MERSHRTPENEEAYNKLRRSTPEKIPRALGLGLCDSTVVLSPEAREQLARDLADLAEQRRAPLSNELIY